MSMASLESAIRNELRGIVKNSSLKVKDMLEWSTGTVQAQDGETIVFVPTYGVQVCIKSVLDKRPKE